MDQSYKAWLKVNNKPVPMNRFVEDFIARTTAGAVASLKGGDDIQNLELHGNKGTIEIKVNSTEIPLTPFPNDLILSTIRGMISSLKDVDGVDKIDIVVEVK